ncbi:TrmH family RNA methyltransferase [Microaceticoccus formicicus]|uniref:TrmH family RNA methyltransferase n=1 Tax=Microaceticoccus formicicus TaxID=3118105 RepID=UPI003CD0026A|nr:RNA methyltransferase [Peptoniphilaceae bacterium AMB_02]
MHNHSIIHSKENKTFQLIKSLNKKKYRVLNRLYLVEGIKMTQEANELKLIEMLIVREADINLIETLFNDIEEDSIIVLADKLFDEITNMQNSEGVMSVIKITEFEEEISSKRVLCLDGIKDPGNMGTIIRSAESFGFNEIILTNECVDIYNPKTLRASMGSVFRIKFKYLETVDILKLRGEYRLYTTSLKDSILLDDAPKDEKIILVIGSESHGVSHELIESADLLVRIPMNGDLESLNAAIAASITMYVFRP